MCIFYLFIVSFNLLRIFLCRFQIYNWFMAVIFSFRRFSSYDRLKFREDIFRFVK